MNYHDIIIKIKILYLHNIEDVHYKYLDVLVNESGIYLDIHLLQLDRLGLHLIYIPQLYINCPNPFREICSNIERKKLVLIQNKTALSKKTIANIYQYIDNGWSYKSPYIRVICSENEKNTCPICTIKLDKKAIKLSCGHSYHYECTHLPCEVFSFRPI